MNELARLEQAEKVKKWCREYGSGIILGIIFAVFISWGWNYWQQSKENYLLAASMQYEYFLASVVKNENTTTLNIAEGLLKNYPHTPYASLAALQLAQHAINQNKLAEAANNLFWVILHGEDQALRSIAQLRLARVLLAEKKPKEALTLLSKNKYQAYMPIFLEEKGDILNNLGHNKEALQSYLAAQKIFASIIEQPLLEMKINNLVYA